MSFHVGQHVICVRIHEASRTHVEILPKKGLVYTVRDVFRGCTGLIGLRLEEIINQPYDYLGGFMECGFSVHHFRPLCSDRLSIFRQHLAPSPTDKVLV